MRLDLKKAVSVPGAEIPFDFMMDLTALEYNGGKPATRPVSVRGRVVNTAGVLNLQMQIEAELSLVCDRCLKPFSRQKQIHVDSVVVPHREREDDDDLIVMDGDGCIDLAEIAETAFILSLDSKNLCRDDCRGLCSRCGADLNLGECGCKKEVDPRLAIFQELLKK